MGRLPFLHASAIAALVLIMLTATTHAQSPTLLAEQEFHGRSAWVIQNGTIRVTLIQAGGHIAEVRLLGEDPQLTLNPMYVPPGTGYVGHLVCFPSYGPASPDERPHGLRGHGEAGSVEWRETGSPRIEAETLTFFYGADLPKTQYRIERAVTVRTGEAAVHVQEWIENLAPYDRPYNWNQHATFGAPFVARERNVLDISGAAALTDARRTGGGQWFAGAELRWPDAPRADGTTVSLREFRARPAGQVYTAGGRRPRTTWAGSRSTIRTTACWSGTSSLLPITPGSSTGRISPKPGPPRASRAGFSSAPRRSTKASAEASNEGSCSVCPPTGGSPRASGARLPTPSFSPRCRRTSPARRTCAGRVTTSRSSNAVPGARSPFALSETTPADTGAPPPFSGSCSSCLRVRRVARSAIPLLRPQP